MINIKNKMPIIKASPAFTLVEMLVVVAIIAIVMGILLPNMENLMGGQSQSMAFNLIDAKLRVARSVAIRDRRYVSVHFQRHHETKQMWCAMMVLDEIDSNNGVQINFGFNDDEYGFPNYTDSGNRYDDKAWILADGSQPSRLPGTWSAGVVCSALGDEYENLYQPVFQNHMDFDSFSIVFRPDGKLSEFAETSNWHFICRNRSSYYINSMFDKNADSYLWDLPTKSDTVVRALCLYSDKETEFLNQAGMENYLDENASFLVVNPRISGLIKPVYE